MAANRSSEDQPYEHGARRALELRLELGLGDEPIPDLWTLVRDRTAQLAFRPFGAAAGDGLYLWNGDTALIIANSSTRSRLRQRFTVAHELGHHELHRPAEGSYLHTDKDIFASTDPVEQEANAFASHLLAPDPAIKRALAEWQVTDISPVVIARLMQRYGISYETAVFRTHNSGVINAGQRDRLLDAKRSSGVRAFCDQIHFNEFLSFPPAGGLPGPFEADVVQAYRAGGIGDDRLAELLRLPRLEALERVREAGVEAVGDELPADEFEALLGG